MKLNSIRIGKYTLGESWPPLVIAEMSGNHNQSLDRALEIIDAAAQAGAHAIKLQTYTADTMTLDLREREFLIQDQQSLWYGKSLYELYREASTPWEWHEPLFDRARKKGLVVFSTPFDATAVDFLEVLGSPCYKVASFENTDLPLIRKVAMTGKPVIISTGMATSEELEETVNCAREAGCSELILLKCTSTYPADSDEANLVTIPDMRNRFGCLVGLSDHTLGIGVPVASVAYGTVAIEKHLTLSRREEGIDAAFSLEPEEFRDLVIETDRAFRALGTVYYGPSDRERAFLQFRRSLYVIENLKAGDRLTERNIRAIRPGLGLLPKFLGEVLNRTVVRDVRRGTPLSWDLIR